MADAPLEPLRALVEHCRVTDGAAFALKDHDPHPPVPAGLEKQAADSLLASGVQRLAPLQDLLYANRTWSLLVVIQAMDAAGKDGTIKHVLSGVNPQGVTVTAFKAPGPEALDHDFLWRTSQALPARGLIGIFNRSHYEDVLVSRVEPGVLARQRVPDALKGARGFWDGRLSDIAAFERHLGREGTRVVKVFLNVSKAEQRKRLIARLDEPDKLWKFDLADLRARDKWEDYAAAYQAAIAATATPDAPWYVVPADRKWLMRLIVMEVVINALTGLDLRLPSASAETLAGLAAARRTLESER